MRQIHDYSVNGTHDAVVYHRSCIEPLWFNHHFDRELWELFGRYAGELGVLSCDHTRDALNEVHIYPTKSQGIYGYL